MMTGRRKNSAMGTSVTKAQVKAMIRNVVSATEELKVNISTFSGTCSVAGVVLTITPSIVQGTDLANRIGEKIAMRQLVFNFQTTMNAAAVADRVRVIVFSDLINQGANPSVADVLNAASVLSPINASNLQVNRFKVYVDHLFQLNTSGEAGANKSFKFKLNTPVFYSGATGTGRGNYYALVISDTPTTLATYAATGLCRYTDA